MNEATKASFKFINYKVSQFSFTDSENSDPQLNINFNVSGRYIVKTGEFNLALEFKASETGKEADPMITANMLTQFKFENSLPLEEIPDYFYKNAIAIGFPYLRGIISTLTLQANLRIIMLPLMNLSNLEEPLRKNTFQVTE